ncbi:uncharacterized protein GGS22DRAFT_188266 [Annulohypoxylon maeteangense]|uniref:uncharacterized protein n=1 Tax=Annulohypoxylon maeteangense TaxID=1927788 RepID=UPI00200882F2|nr:uncharacterized protein GGS22DRAFT_188266 [Annulohypoxylon maeteangense]KAI0884990.1 hypothetical protein GGS22DRAFT_188266 [Annulohypoxylon maeteangense]
MARLLVPSWFFSTQSKRCLRPHYRSHHSRQTLCCFIVVTLNKAMLPARTVTSTTRPSSTGTTAEGATTTWFLKLALHKDGNLQAVLRSLGAHQAIPTLWR